MPVTRSAAAIALTAALWPSTSAAQSLRRIVSSEISISRDAASLHLEFESGSKASFALVGGRILVNGDDVGAAARGTDMDRAWRALLSQAMDAPTGALARMLVDWDAPDEAFDARLEALLGEAAEAAPALAPAEPAEPLEPAAAPDLEFSDSVDRLVGRIAELEGLVGELESGVAITIPDIRVDRTRPGPFRHLIRGFEGLFSVSVLYAVLFGIAFATIFFGGRRFIEGVADTARAATTRSLLVGLAATFLVIPAYILGLIALAISIVGILALPVWLLLFPVAAALAVLLGYIGVAHAAGESLAERRFYATDWFRRGNSYYFLLTGLGLLLVLFAAGSIVGMAGPWLGFLRGLLFTVASVVTWAALSIGLGAVLLSRGGTKPLRRPGTEPEPEIYAEATNV
jgi:hypothetical protein